MNGSSFRLRIAFSSSALAGIALLGFGVLSWVQINNAKLGQLDTELMSQLFRAKDTPIFLRWQPFANSVHLMLGAKAETSVALFVLDAQGEEQYGDRILTTDPSLRRFVTESLASLPPMRFPPGGDHHHPPMFPFPPGQAPPAPLPSGDPPPWLRPHPPHFFTTQTATGNWRVSAARFPDLQVAIAVNLEILDRDMATIRQTFLILIPGALALIAVGAWMLAGSALRPIGQLTAAIQQVTAKGLDQRVPIGKTDVEFVELIAVFNQMLERLERSFLQASRFSGDAAHELKTPLTILQGELERTLQEVDPGSQVQQRLSNLLDEVSRLSSIVRKLLLLSLADAGQLSLYVVEVNLSSLLIEMVEDLELLAPHLSVKSDILPELRVQGDRDLLTQVLQNLFGNAIKYNLPKGFIQVQAYADPQAARITITNSSDDILVGDRDRIFDRFYRGDPARTRTIEGLGLGLSLAREIAKAHQGQLTLESSNPGQTVLTLTLPLPNFR